MNGSLLITSGFFAGTVWFKKKIRKCLEFMVFSRHFYVFENVDQLTQTIEIIRMIRLFRIIGLTIHDHWPVMRFSKKNSFSLQISNQTLVSGAFYTILECLWLKFVLRVQIHSKTISKLFVGRTNTIGLASVF